jgi:hypothetical protein
MGAIGSSKYTVYKSPTENLRQSTGLYATSPNDIPDGLIGADFNIFSKPQETAVVSAGKAMPKLNSAQDILSAKRNASAAAGGSSVAPNLLDTASGTSTQAGKTSFTPYQGFTQGQKTGIGVAGMVSDTVGEIADAKKNLAVDEYLMDLNYWKEQGKIWFDKDANYAPTFEEYAPDMPSAVDTLKEGSITGSNVADSAIGGATTGAMAGAMLGPVGAVVGGVAGGLVGLITGFMAGDAAENQDAKTKERAYNEYKAKLKTWTYSRNLKNQQDRISKEDETTEKSKAIVAGNKRLKKEKLEKISASKNANRNRMVEVLSKMGSAGNQAAQQRKARWQ